jgi:hypothetical protein
MTVGQRELGEDHFQLVRLEGKWLEARGRLSTDIAWDSHNSVTMAIDKDDQIHLCGNMHVEPLIYFRTVTARCDILRASGLHGGEQRRSMYLSGLYAGPGQRAPFPVPRRLEREWGRLLQPV